MATRDTLPVGWLQRGGSERQLALPLTTVLRHALVTGTTGWGKSGLLQSIMLGLLARHPHVHVVLIDPKGETAGVLRDHFLPVLAQKHARLRPDRLVSVAPFTGYAVPLNPFHPIPHVAPEVQAHLVCALIGGLVDGFGARMTSLLSTLVRAVMAVEGSLLDVHRILTDDGVRARIAGRLANADLRIALTTTFEREPASSKDAIRARLEWLLLLPAVRSMLCARGCLPGSALLDGPVTIIDLGGAPQGQVAIGRFVGALVFQLLTAAVFNRTVLPDTPPVLVVGEEWQEWVRVAAEDVERLLSLARFKKVGLWLANQDLAQISAVSPALCSSLLTNVAIQVAFRPNPADLRHLLPLLPVTGQVIDPDQPDRRWSPQAEQRALLDSLGRLPPRHAVLADRVAGEAHVIRTLSVPFDEARERAERLPASDRLAFIRGRFAVPQQELPLAAPKLDVDPESVPADGDGSEVRVRSWSGTASRRRSGRPVLELP